MNLVEKVEKAGLKLETLNLSGKEIKIFLFLLGML